MCSRNSKHRTAAAAAPLPKRRTSSKPLDFIAADDVEKIMAELELGQATLTPEQEFCELACDVGLARAAELLRRARAQAVEVAALFTSGALLPTLAAGIPSKLAMGPLVGMYGFGLAEKAGKAHG